MHVSPMKNRNCPLNRVAAVNVNMPVAAIATARNMGSDKFVSSSPLIAANAK